LSSSGVRLRGAGAPLELVHELAGFRGAGGVLEDLGELLEDVRELAELLEDLDEPPELLELEGSDGRISRAKVFSRSSIVIASHLERQ
jgi:hypothetical protein